METTDTPPPVTAAQIRAAFDRLRLADALRDAAHRELRALEARDPALYDVTVGRGGSATVTP